MADRLRNMADERRADWLSILNELLQKEFLIIMSLFFLDTINRLIYALMTGSHEGVLAIVFKCLP